MTYFIRNTDEPKLFWSNRFGWTTKRQATKFKTNEVKGVNKLNLPIAGEWFATF